MSRRREEQDLMDKIIHQDVETGKDSLDRPREEGFSYASPFCDTYQIRQPPKMLTEKGVHRKG